MQFRERGIIYTSSFECFSQNTNSCCYKIKFCYLIFINHKLWYWCCSGCCTHSIHRLRTGPEVYQVIWVIILFKYLIMPHSNKDLLGRTLIPDFIYLCSICLCVCIFTIIVIRPVGKRYIHGSFFTISVNQLLFSHQNTKCNPVYIIPYPVWFNRKIRPMHILTIDRLFTNNLFSVTFYEQTSCILFYLIWCKLLTISTDKPKYTFTNWLLLYINTLWLTFNNHRIIPHPDNTSASNEHIFNGPTHCAVKVVHI